VRNAGGALTGEHEQRHDRGEQDGGGRVAIEGQTPFATGLSRKSPTTAPSGRVRTKADQNKTTREIR